MTVPCYLVLREGCYLSEAIKERGEWQGMDITIKKGKLINRSERWWRWSFGLLEEMRKIFAIVGTIISRKFRKQKNRFNVEVSLWRVKNKSHEDTLDVVLVRTKQRFRSRVAVQETAWNWRCTWLRVLWRNTLHVAVVAAASADDRMIEYTVITIQIPPESVMERREENTRALVER